MGQTTQASGQGRRYRAAKLLNAVLDETLLPRAALNQWPADAEGVADVSLKAAYNALWHFEADEDQQQSILFYTDTQLELLRQMAQYLGKGKDLPPHLIAGYQTESPTAFYHGAHVLWAPLQKLREYGQAFQQVWRYTRQQLLKKRFSSF